MPEAVTLEPHGRISLVTLVDESYADDDRLHILIEDRFYPLVADTTETAVLEDEGDMELAVRPEAADGCVAKERPIKTTTDLTSETFKFLLL